MNNEQQYRYLQLGEEVQDGDECQLIGGSGTWTRLLGVANHVQHGDTRYRRPIAPETAAAPKPQLFVLMKRGLYYRPNSHGYTSNIEEAWKLTESEADKRVYPHDTPVTKHPYEPSPAAAALAAARAEVARLQQLLDPAALEARIAERERALVEQVAGLREAATKAYSLLSMLPAREFWNPADAANSFDGRYGKLMREKFDAAWEALEAEGFGKLEPEAP